MREVPTFNGWLGGRKRYDWDRMFNGKKWAVHRSQMTSQRAFQRLAHKRAASRGVKSRTSVDGDEVVVQALMQNQDAIEPMREVGEHET